jgi:hypothetical protein
MAMLIFTRFLVRSDPGLLERSFRSCTVNPLEEETAATP